jgi:hypothetical protein
MEAACRWNFSKRFIKRLINAKPHRVLEGGLEGWRGLPRLSSGVRGCELKQQQLYTASATECGTLVHFILFNQNCYLDLLH